MSVYRRGKVWWYRFAWRGEVIRRSTKQSNKRTAEQMEAACRTALAKGEVGIKERKSAPTLKQFAERHFLPFVQATFQAKPKTRLYYENGVKNLLAFERLASERLDRITTDLIAGYVARRQKAGLKVSSINRELQALRRMFRLAQEWRNVDSILPSVKMLSGENHRERVISSDEEKAYLTNASPIVRDVATIMLDCGLRPEECFRLKRENVREGSIVILAGKTSSARRRIPMSQRVTALLEMRISTAGESDWLFPASTASGHIEPSSVRRQHRKACADAEIVQFDLYTLRHTCLTRWAPHMDPWTLAYLAGHRDMAITKRYVHPQSENIQRAMKQARGGHNSGHTYAPTRNELGEGTPLIN